MTRTFQALFMLVAFALPAAAAGDDSPWRLFGGAGTGIGVTGSLSGTQTVLSARLDRRWRSWAADAGLGWGYSYFGGEESAGREARIMLRHGVAEASARYRVSESWLLGPVAHAGFGADTSLRPAVGPSERTVFAGLRSAYEFELAGFPAQAWQQATTEISSGPHRLYSVMVGLHFGLPLGMPRSFQTKVAVTDTLRTSTSSPQVRIELDPQKIFFGTNSSRLRPQVASVLHQVGLYLKEHDRTWDTVDIEGHADRRGRFAYNLELSRKRARQVLDGIIAGGAEASRLRAEGYSYERPMDPGSGPRAWSRNRRVEIVFNRVADASRLRELLQPLSKETP